MKCSAGDRCQNGGKVGRIFALQSEDTQKIYCSVWCSNASGERQVWPVYPPRSDPK